MSTAPSTAFRRPPVEEPAPTITESRRPSSQAYRILQIGFIVLPILAGADKFLHRLVNWDKYLAPILNELVQGHGHQLMLAAGVVEVIVGIGVAWKPRVFSYIVALWLAGIIANLLLIPGYFDVALRDFGLLLAALALGRLSAQYAVRR